MPVGSMDEFLPSAFRSIQNQTYKDFVCHILCGKLGDDELKAIVELVSKDERFVLHHLHLNGISFALNYGVNLVKTKYVARMDSDDISDPLRFETQISYLKDNPDISVLGSYVTEFNPQTQSRRLRKVPTEYKLMKKYIKYRSPLNHATVIFKKDDVNKAGGYESVLRYEDFYLWSKMIALGLKIANIPISLVDVRAGDDLIKRLNGVNAFNKDLFFFKKLYSWYASRKLCAKTFIKL